MAKKKAQRAGADEALLLDDGIVREARQLELLRRPRRSA